MLVNLEQEDILVDIQGQRVKGGNGKVTVLDPSTGKISTVSLPARLTLEANRSILVMPGGKYLSKPLLN